MKKVLVFLFACLASTTMFAAGEYFEVVPVTTQPFYTKLPCVILIDGVEQFNTNLELGVFDDNDICRGTAVGAENPRTHRVFFNLRFKALAEGTEMHLKVYDHASGQILNLVPDLEEPITYQGNYTYPWNGSNAGAMNPIELNFISSASEGIDLDITGYGEGTGNWYLISSPVGGVDIENVQNMRANNYDLYYFDQQEGNEWINYKPVEDTVFDPAFLQMEAGKGYLYANSGDVTLTFPGSANTEDVNITLDKAGTDNPLDGWNLIGNPFNEDFSMGDRAFYVMNNGTDIAVSTRTYLEPKEGAFIIAATNGEEFTFSLNNRTTEPAELVNIAINVSQSSTLIDRAVVRIGESRSELPKFQLNPSHTKVYIPKDGADYAVVSTGEMGEMPVNFKAESNGSYTMSLNQNSDFAYLHLIDNMTGADIDMLATPAYTFDAKTTDYASRFKLVFATGNNDETFAFLNNGNLIISNEGEATLQVVDVNGRILRSESINGCASVSVDAANGVYMLRLINGNDVKVQKIVVR